MKKLVYLVLLLPLLSLMAGCNLIQAPLQIDPQRKSTPIAPHFSESYYYYDADQNVYIVMTSTNNDASGRPVQQVATIRVFWRPRGGVTTLDSTAINATFRYMIFTPDSIGMYEGAGFVRLDSSTGASTMSARVVSADMRLTQSSANFTDTLGRARMHGGISAKYDDAKAEAMLLDVERQFYARSLASKSATASAPATSTQPAETMPTSAPAGPAGTNP